MQIAAVHDLSKTFGNNNVLDRVSFNVESGEVHGLLGHNGSGKSTLIKILAGIYDADSGSVIAGDEELPLPLHPDNAREHGFAFVHQGLGLASELSILDNLAVSRFIRTFTGRINWAAHLAQARETLDAFGVTIDPRTRVADLEPVDQAIVAIARALNSLSSGSDRRLLVLDEPTVYLPRNKVSQLFAAVRRLTERGDGVLFVSHRLEEALELTDRVSVLRDGKLVATRRTADLTEKQLVRLIVGRDLHQHETSPAMLAQPKPVLRIDRLTSPSLYGVSLTVDHGEIVGLAGIPGSGFDEVPYALFGVMPEASGILRLGEVEADLEIMTVGMAIGLGIALVPEDRGRLGVALDLSVRENASILSLKDLVRAGGLSGSLERAHVAGLIEAFGVRGPGPEASVDQLSGGNQQKLVLGKWLTQRPRLILLHEPTQCEDVEGRFEIWRHLSTAATQGAAVLIASESAEELAELCDRVLIFRDGQIAAELRGEEVDQHRIVEHVVTETSPLRDAIGSEHSSVGGA